MIDGIQSWAAKRGEYILPVEDFMNEVKSFHQRFIADMAGRVQTISKNNPFVYVKLDIAALKKEQDDRANLLKESLSMYPQIENWTTQISNCWGLNDYV